METAILVTHILVALGIIALVLIQHGKGADAGAAFGGGGGGGASGSVFGAQGSSNFLSRATAILATLFFISSLSMAYLSKSVKPTESLMSPTSVTETVPAPETPAKDLSSDAPVVPKEEAGS